MNRLGTLRDVGAETEPIFGCFLDYKSVPNGLLVNMGIVKLCICCNVFLMILSGKYMHIKQFMVLAQVSRERSDETAQISPEPSLLAGTY